MSIGVGVTPLEPGEMLEPALRRADEAPHRATRDGRERVETSIVAAPPPGPCGFGLAGQVPAPS